LRLAYSCPKATFPSFSQDSLTFRACNEKGKTQAEMNGCASNELARDEAQIDDIYNTLLSKTASQPEALVKIKAAQKT